ncbi:MAG: MarR family transcriptional regulator [Actinomycetia bacterium]|nr:MarR family transcriptional regulator [Actinomycetes bacterium]
MELVFGVVGVVGVGETDSTRLAAELGLTPGTVTGVRTGLEKQGLVTNRPDPSDGRRRVIAQRPIGR